MAVARARRIRCWSTIVGVAIGTLVVADGCQRRESTLDRIRARGVIRIGYAVEAPYAFLTPEGKVTGESIEVAKVVAARLHIPRIVWTLTEFGSLIQGLEDHRYDVIAAGMFVTTERERRVAFSRPTFSVHPGLLVHHGNPDQLHGWDDLVRDEHVRVAVLSGSVEEAEMRRAGFAPARLVQVPDARAGFEAVASGAVDALLLSAPTVRWMARQPNAGDVEVCTPFISKAPLGTGAFAFRRSDPALRDAWNTALTGYVGSPDHVALIRQFGFTAADLPR